MFNDDFYPTPQGLIDKMLDGVDFYRLKSVLEPSAGKGDLAEVIKRVYDAKIGSNWRGKSELDLDVIEIEPELQMILKGKEFRVVHDDFLSYSTFKQYDLIISNPPFSQGAKHLLKMLEMQERAGGAIICLLNAETLKNPYSVERKALLQKLTDYNATIDYIEDAFIDAERSTGVEIALVKVDIPKEEKVSFIFEETLKKAKDLEYKEREDPEATSLVENDFLRAFVKQYEVEVEAGVKLIDEYNAMKPHILNSFDNDSYSKPILELSLNGAGNSLSYNNFVKSVRMKYWKALFSNPKFTGRLTSKLLSEYQNRVQELAEYEFSLYNITTIRVEMFKGVIKGVEDTILELFEDFSHKYHYLDENSKNIHYFNGWKTNKSWVINEKVIIPLNAFRHWSWDKSCEYEPDKHEVQRKLSDIEKVFNYLDGGRTDSVDLHSALVQAKSKGTTKKIQLKYFTVTFFKKGTCHIEFTNLEILKKFNIFGAQNKNWLPPHYGKKGYDEMSKEEQAVIDEFEGKAEYEKVMRDSSYYLASADKMLMIEG